MTPGLQLDGTTSGISFTDDGATWTEVDLGALFASGEGMFDVRRNVSASPHGVTIAAAVGGLIEVEAAPAVTVAAGDSAESPTASTMLLGGFQHERFEILHSVDGVAWSRESVAELAGVDDGDILAVTRVQQAGDSVVVAVQLKAVEDQIPEQIVLVGTPRG